MADIVTILELEIHALKKRVAILEAMADIHEKDVEATGQIIKSIILDLHPEMAEEPV